MAINRPLDQGLTVLANEQRQKSPLVRPLKKVVSFVSAIADATAALKSGNLGEAVLKISAP
jgi:hypothetical protein